MVGTHDIKHRNRDDSTSRIFVQFEKAEGIVSKITQIRPKYYEIINKLRLVPWYQLFLQ